MRDKLGWGSPKKLSGTKTLQACAASQNQSNQESVCCCTLYKSTPGGAQPCLLLSAITDT
jgi:hypothetical protein